MLQIGVVLFLWVVKSESILTWILEQAFMSCWRRSAYFPIRCTGFSKYDAKSILSFNSSCLDCLFLIMGRSETNKFSRYTNILKHFFIDWNAREGLTYLEECRSVFTHQGVTFRLILVVQGIEIEFTLMSQEGWSYFKGILFKSELVWTRQKRNQ